MDKQIRNKYTYYILLILFFLALVAIKISFSFQLSKYNSNTPDCYFQSEAALQFHFAEEIANGRSLPKTIDRLQVPEGVRIGEDITVFQEYVCGWSYRYLIRPIVEIDFFPYAISFNCFVSTLPLFIIFFFGQAVIRSNWAAWTAGLLYGLHPLNYTRVVGNFGRENFSLSFVFLSIFILIYIWQSCLKKETVRKIAFLLAIAVIAQVIAFSSWHLARFIFTLEMGIITLLCLTRIMAPRQQLVTGVWVLCLIPFIFIIPALSCRHFLFSPGILLGVYLVIDYWLNQYLQKNRWKRLAVFSGFVLLILLLPHSNDSHVSTVVIDKLRYFLIKPEDPTLLSPESRLMWIEAFLSPPIDRIIYYFLPMTPLVVFGLIGLGKAWKGLPSLRLPIVFLLANTLVFTGFYLLFERLHVLQTFFLITLVVFGTRLYLRKSTNKLRWSIIYTIIISLLYFLETITLQTGNPVRSYLSRQLGEKPVLTINNYHQNNLDLIQWIREETDPDTVYAGWIGMATWTYAYADRPVILHSKFENNTVRDKTLEFINALYSSEEALTEFFRTYQGDYLIYQPEFFFDQSSQSLRYIAGHQQVSPQMPVVQLQFFPLDLENFELVYQNPGFRVYRFLKTPETPYENRPINYEPCYDRVFFDIKRNDDSLKISKLKERLELIDSLYQSYAMALNTLNQGDFQSSASTLHSIGEKCPLFYRSWLMLGQISLKQNTPSEAKSYFKRALEGAPDNEEIKDLLKKANEMEKGVPPNE